MLQINNFQPLADDIYLVGYVNTGDNMIERGSEFLLKLQELMEAHRVVKIDIGVDPYKLEQIKAKRN